MQTYQLQKPFQNAVPERQSCIMCEHKKLFHCVSHKYLGRNSYCLSLPHVRLVRVIFAFFGGTICTIFIQEHSCC